MKAPLPAAHTTWPLKPPQLSRGLTVAVDDATADVATASITPAATAASATAPVRTGRSLDICHLPSISAPASRCPRAAFHVRACSGRAQVQAGEGDGPGPPVPPC